MAHEQLGLPVGSSHGVTLKNMNGGQTLTCMHAFVDLLQTLHLTGYIGWRLGIKVQVMSLNSER